MNFHSIELNEILLITRCVNCYEQEGIWLFSRLFEQSTLLRRLQIEHNLFTDAIDFVTVCLFKNYCVRAGSALLEREQCVFLSGDHNAQTTMFVLAFVMSAMTCSETPWTRFSTVSDP